jgi:hypothetical protein
MEPIFSNSEYGLNDQTIRESFLLKFSVFMYRNFPLFTTLNEFPELKGQDKEYSSMSMFINNVVEYISAQVDYNCVDYENEIYFEDDEYEEEYDYEDINEYTFREIVVSGIDEYLGMLDRNGLIKVIKYLDKKIEEYYARNNGDQFDDIENV